MIAANTHTNSTAQVGVRFLPRRRHRLWPGTAPSREKANVIREALVTHAMPQNSWPAVDIRITALAAAELRAVVKIVRARYPVLRISVSWLFCAAEVIASSTIQPITAE